MKTAHPGSFTRPDILCRIRPDLLLAWLAPWKAYFESRGLPLPDPSAIAAGPPLDYQQLFDCLVEPSDAMPPELAESLYLIDEMADEPGMDALLAGLRKGGWAPLVSETLTPVDVAVQAWILDRGLLQELHTCRELRRPRAFTCYGTNARPVPAFPGPGRAQLSRLEERLNAFYTAWKRGPGARVFAHPSHGAWHFLIRHGAPCRREPALDAGLPTSVFFRPQRHAVLLYEPRRGELQINCCAQREQRVLLRLFGACFFGRTDFFPDHARFTLAPLVEQGRRSLACADIPALHHVTLTEVEFAYYGTLWKRVAHKAADIFDLVESGELHWPLRPEHITRARFAVLFNGARRERFLTLCPSNRVAYSRDHDSHLLEEWMRSRNFML
jgi:hypothetical protein